MGESTRFKSGDPLAGADPSPDSAVERGGELERHQRAPEADSPDESSHHLARFRLANALGYLDAGVAQPVDAGAIDPGIGIGHCDDCARDPGVDQ